MQPRVLAADAVLLVFPLWWGGVPAVLKGWFDRVLAYGFAYAEGRRFETGLFAGRSGLLGVVTGGTPQRFSRDGVYGTIDQVLWPTQRCILEYLGVDSGEPFVAYGAPSVDEQTRRAYLDEWAGRVLALRTRTAAPSSRTAAATGRPSGSPVLARDRPAGAARGAVPTAEPASPPEPAPGTPSVVRAPETSGSVSTPGRAAEVGNDTTNGCVLPA